MVCYFYFPQILQFKGNSHVRLFPSPTWIWVYLSQKPHKRLGQVDHKYGEHISISCICYHHSFHIGSISFSGTSTWVSTRTTQRSAITPHSWKRWPGLRLHMSTSAPRNTVTCLFFLTVNQRNHVRITFTNEKKIPHFSQRYWLFNYFAQ